MNNVFLKTLLLFSSSFTKLRIVISLVLFVIVFSGMFASRLMQYVPKTMIQHTEFLNIHTAQADVNDPWSFTPGLYGVTSLCANGIQDSFEEGIDKGGACGYNYPDDLPSPLPAGVEVYYISESEGNDSYDGLSPTYTSGNNGPWKTLNKLHNSWNLIGPGDYILFKRGDTWRPTSYPDGYGSLIAPPLGKAGTANAYITIGAYGSGNKPVISAGNVPAVDGAKNVIYTYNGMAYFKFQDLEFRGAVWLRSWYGTYGVIDENITKYQFLKFHRITLNADYPGDATGGNMGFDTAIYVIPPADEPETYWQIGEVHDIEVAYSEFNDMTGNDGIGVGGQGNVWIHHNEIYNTRGSNESSGGESIDFHEGNNVRIEYNILSGSSGYNLKVLKHGHTFDNCIIRGNLMMGSDNYPNNGIGTTPMFAIGTRWCIIEDNTFVANQGGWNAGFDGYVNPFFSPDSMDEYGFFGNTVRNNIFYGGSVSMQVPTQIQVTYRNGTEVVYNNSEMWEDNTFANNTYYNYQNPNGERIYYRNFNLPGGPYWTGYTSNRGYEFNWNNVYTDYGIGPSNFNSLWASKPGITGERSDNPQLLNPYWNSARDYGNYRVDPDSPSWGRGAYAAVDGGSGEPIVCSTGQTRSCSTGLSGVCSVGLQTCTNNAWGACNQTTQSSTEICGNNIDEDCNGSDLLCSNSGSGSSGSGSSGNSGVTVCSTGQTRSCSTGLSGVCSVGLQTCTNNAWGACNQTTQSSTEICGNNIDEDCNGSDLLCILGNQTPSQSGDGNSREIEQEVFVREQQRITTANQSLINRLQGRILLQVQEKGEAWYIPLNLNRRYYLSNRYSAFEMLRQFGLGITNADLAKIPVGIEKRFADVDTDNDGLPDKLEEALGTQVNDVDSDNDGHNDGVEVSGGYSPLGTNKLIFNQSLSNRLRGHILLQVESRGQAWYINPVDGKRYYMKDGEAAFQIMRFLSLGITNADLAKIPLGEIY